MQRNQVDDENVSSPCTNHVKVGEGAKGRPEHGSSVHGSHPHCVGEDQRENGNTFIIEGSSHGTGDVSYGIYEDEYMIMGYVRMGYVR